LCRVRSVHSDVDSDPGADLGLGDEEPVEQRPQPAVILKGPEDVTVLQGAGVELEVHFTGWPPPQVRWFQGVSIFHSVVDFSFLPQASLSPTPHLKLRFRFLSLVFRRSSHR